MDDDSDTEAGTPQKEPDPKRRAIMRSRRGRTRETFWYTIAGYVFVTAFTAVSVTIGVAVYGLPLDSGLLLLGLIAFSIVPYPALALDAGYLKAMESPWVPRTRRYAGVGFATPILFGLVSGSALTTVEAIGVGLFSFLPITVALSVVYLAQRHRHVGIP